MTQYWILWVYDQKVTAKRWSSSQSYDLDLQNTISIPLYLTPQSMIQSVVLSHALSTVIITQQTLFSRELIEKVLFLVNPFETV